MQLPFAAFSSKMCARLVMSFRADSFDFFFFFWFLVGGGGFGAVGGGFCGFFGFLWMGFLLGFPFFGGVGVGFFFFFGRPFLRQLPSLPPVRRFLLCRRCSNLSTAASPFFIPSESTSIFLAFSKAACFPPNSPPFPHSAFRQPF